MKHIAGNTLVYGDTRPANAPPIYFYRWSELHRKGSTLTSWALLRQSFYTYVRKIDADFQRGIATGYTHRSTLENLLDTFESDVAASSDPQYIDFNIPDFMVEKNTSRQIKGEKEITHESNPMS